jgi:hypothetical protein
VISGGRHLKRLVTRKARLIGLLAILTISSMNGFVGYFLTTLDPVGSCTVAKSAGIPITEGRKETL